MDLRRMRLSANAERARTSLGREVSILKMLPPHPNIVQMIDAFQEGEWFLIILELVGGGDLFTAITSRQPPRLVEQEAAHVARQLSDGLSFLHSHGVIHRDLKLDNILVASERRYNSLVLFTVKITDFGLSKNVGEDLSAAVSLVGTRPYTAPEVIARGAYDFSSDLWGLGVLLYTLLVGKFPFQQIPAQQVDVESIINERISGSDAAKSVVSGLLQLEPRRRLILKHLCAHEWLQQRLDVLELGRQAKRKRLSSGSPTLQPISPASVHLPPALDGAATEEGSSANPRTAMDSVAEPLPLPAATCAPQPLDFVEPQLQAEDQTLPPPLPSHRAAGATSAEPSAAVESGGMSPAAAAGATAGIGAWLAFMYAAVRGTSSSASTPSASAMASASSTSAAVPEPSVKDLEKMYPSRLGADVMQVYMAVQRGFEGALSGKAGVQLSKIGASVGCEIRAASHAAIGHQLVSITGSYNQCVLAQEVLWGRLAGAMRDKGQPSCDEVEVALLVRAEAAGVVVGKRGAVLSSIRKKSGARVWLLHEQLGGHRPCILSGTLQSVLYAERHVFHLTRAVPTTRASDDGEVPSRSAAVPAAVCTSPSPIPFSPYPATPLPSPRTSP
eukprot:TRINITY_DN22443_c0_g2_i1.p1 TRINITY_DN22443_c0_g2~~TRINITY_DN22443_c0_g2_i1.p1  ORF type:complete len:717 (-),score=119.49 TRINITY_DN22443_c0_g2_i1:83-1927(-)